jgi:predicted transcriptional regulator
VRGPEFEPRFFRIEKLSSPDIKDDEGFDILLPVMRPTSEQAAEQRQETKAATNLDILKVMMDDPKGTQPQWAMRLGMARTTLRSKLEVIARDKLVEKSSAAPGKFSITPKGRKAVKQFTVINGGKRDPEDNPF